MDADHEQWIQPGQGVLAEYQARLGSLSNIFKIVYNSHHSVCILLQAAFSPLNIMFARCIHVDKDNSESFIFIASIVWLCHGLFFHSLIFGCLVFLWSLLSLTCSYLMLSFPSGYLSFLY